VEVESHRFPSCPTTTAVFIPTHPVLTSIPSLNPFTFQEPQGATLPIHAILPRNAFMFINGILRRVMREIDEGDGTGRVVRRG
jgi:hypothetical protein